MTIFSVSTALGEGKGGISTALVGLSQSDAFSQQEVRFIASHKAGHRLQGLKGLISLMRDCQPKDLVWLHCGQWFSMLRKALYALAAKLKGASVVFHFHAVALDGYFQHPVWRHLVALMLRMADGIVVVSPWWKSRILEHFPHLKTAIHIAPNPLNTELELRARSLKYRAVDGGKVRLLAMSRLVKGKGFEQAINCLSVLPEHYTLTIAGDGELRRALTQLVHKLNLEHRVDIVGWLDNQDKLSALSEHDIFLLPSKNDSFGMGFIEAMACGLPVVALNYQATPDVVKDDKVGKLSQQDDPQSLATAVLNCTEHHESYSTTATCYAVETFNKEQVAEDLLAFFKQF